MGLFYNLIIPLIGLILMAGSLYYAREQVRIMKAAPSANQRAKAVAVVSARPWWKSWQLAVMAVLFALTWVPFGYGLLFPPVEFAQEMKWGGLPDGDLYVSVILPKAKSDRKIVLVALHYNGRGDIKDAKGIQKSEPYDYGAGLQTFIVAPDQTFRNEAAAGMRGVTFLLLDLPNTVNEAQFSTVRQAIALGGKVVATRAVDDQI